MKNRDKVVTIKTKRRSVKSIGMDYNLIAIIFILCAVGLIMVYSTSYYTALDTFGSRFYYFNKQLIATIIGIIAMFITAIVVDVRKLNSKTVIMFLLFVSVVAMLLVLSPIGFEAYGARRWINVPIFGSMQPSEFAKITFILFVAWYLSKKTTNNSSVKTFIKVLGMSIVMAGIIYAVTDHLSAGIIVILISMIMAAIANKNTAKILTILSLGIGFFYVFMLYYSKNFMQSSKSFRFNRILVWANPEEYIDRGGYQIIQGLYAIGSGGFLGRGFGKSTQKLGFIPEAQNDMIIAIFIEEMGILGIIVLLSLFLYLLYRLILIAKNCDDLFSFLVVVGIFSHISTQVVLNMCVVLNIIPTTGITMPFISYGGSSIVLLLMEVGLALGLSNRFKKKAYLEVE